MEKFHYTTPANKKISLPRYEDIPMGVIRAIRKIDDEFEATFVLIEKVSDAKTAEAIEALSLSEFKAFSEAWQDDSQVSLGESSAS